MPSKYYKVVKRSTYDRNVKSGVWLVVVPAGDRFATIEEQRPNRSGCAGIRYRIEFTSPGLDAAMARVRAEQKLCG
jgi:hypothetical protein